MIRCKTCRKDERRQCLKLPPAPQQLKPGSTRHHHRIPGDPLPITSSRHIPSTSIMINAVLVFNNNGQPRLTKFYSQIARPLAAGPTFPQV